MKTVSRKQWIGASAGVLVLAIAGALGVHYEGNRLNAYRDMGGMWTVCHGHTQGVTPDTKATPEQCAAYLKSDMATAYGYVQKCITAPLTVTQQAAFTDAVYNAGPGIVCGSTLQRLANAGDVQSACKQLLRWVHVDGRVVDGLVKRRQSEYELCVSGLH